MITASNRHARALGLVSTLLLAACGVPTAPGMINAPPGATPSHSGSLLVVYPTSPCTGSDSAIFVDTNGAFIAAVVPGTATYVAFPPGADRLVVLAGADVAAPPGTWFNRHVVARPAEFVDHGIVMEMPRYDARNCYRYAAPAPRTVTFEVAAQAAKTQRWLAVAEGEPSEGTLLLEAHRARVGELLTRTPRPPR